MSENYVNVIVADKQPHLTLLDMEAAVLHCTKGIGVWDWASTESKGEPDVVLACAGDVPTMEALAAAEILRDKFPELKVRFVNIVDLYRLVPPSSHPHGLTDEDFDAFFTHDKPVIFNFHSYPALVHKLIYKRRGHANFHVHGYREKGSISTPLELAILNHIDRFSLCIDVIDQVPQLGGAASHVREWLNEQIIEHVEYAHREGIDQDQIRNWSWSGDLAPKRCKSMS